MIFMNFVSSQRFLCGGRLVFGPDATSVFLSMFLIATPTIVFCAQVIVKIHNREINRTQPHSHHILGYPVLIVATLLLVAVRDHHELLSNTKCRFDSIRHDQFAGNIIFMH